MYKNLSVSVVIPCHNEEESISSVVNSLPEWVDEIIVVDNNSIDLTGERAEAAGAKVVTESVVGYGAAYLAGFKVATGEVIATLDGDGQYASREIETLVNHLIDGQKDLVVGNRIKDGVRPAGLNMMRYIGNRGLSLATRVLFGKKIQDSQSGMWAFRKSILSKINLQTTGMTLSEEIKVKAVLSKLNYSEVPISYDERKGDSKLSLFKDGFKNLLYLLQMFILHHRSVLGKVLLTLFLLGLITNLLFSIPGIAGGDDGYRHIKFAAIIRQQGWEQAAQYPWLTKTFPENKPVDLWFLYHILLVPFTLISNLLLASKLATLLLVALLGVVFFRVLKAQEVAYPWLWLTLLALGSVDFMFRLTLGRPLLLNITFCLLAILLLIKQKYWPLVLVSTLFMLTNVAAVLLLPLIGAYIFARLVIDRKFTLLPLLCVIVGLAVGLLIHPQFPDNVHLAFIQIFDTQFTAIKDNVKVGNEIYPYSRNYFLQSNFLIFVLWLIASGLYIYQLVKRKTNSQTLFIFLSSIFAFVLTLKSKRFIEYYAPMSLLFSALIYKDYLINVKWHDLKHGFEQHWQIIAGFTLVVMLAVVGLGYNYQQQLDSVSTSPTGVEYKGVAAWLIDHSQTGEIVFNSQWDQFPQMFFYDDKNYYIAGIDPTFIYIRNPEDYQKWKTITDEHPELWTDSAEIHRQIKEDFNSKYILVEPGRNPRLAKFLTNQPEWYEIHYQDEITTLFWVK